MKERNCKPDLFDLLHRANDAFTQRQTGDRFPVVTVNPTYPRTDSAGSIFAEADDLSGLLREGNAFCGVTIAPSAHTPVLMDTKDFVSAVRNIFHREAVRLPFLLPEKISAHLIIWWGESKSGEIVRCDFSRLAGLPDSQRQPFINVIASQTASAVSVLKDVFRLSDENIAQWLEIYGLSGHTTGEERTETGLSRGAQSNPHGHQTVIALPYSQVESYVDLMEITKEERLKQTGPWDTVIFELFRTPVWRIIRDISSKRIPKDIVYAVESYSDDKRWSNGKSAPFFEGFKVSFRGGIDYGTAMHVLLDINNHFEVFYQRVNTLFGDYYKAIGSVDGRKKVLEKVEETALKSGFTKQEARDVLAFFLSVKPTFGQLNLWIKELEGQLGADKKMSFDRLSRMRTVYEGMANDLNNTQVRRGWERQLAGFYDLDTEEAGLLVRIMEDMFKDPTKNDPQTGKRAIEDIQFTLPGHFSISYMFEGFRLVNGLLIVDGVSVASRLGTPKGALEDVGGFIVRRPENK